MRTRLLGRTVTAALLAACLVLSMLAIGLLTGRYRVLPVLSGSMDPAIAAGDLVVATPKATGVVREGDVIVFHPPGESYLVVHRVVEVDTGKNGPIVTTKGDDNAAADPWRAELLGTTAWQVERVVPKAGHLAVLAKRPNVRLIAIVIAASVFFIVTVRSIWSREPQEEGLGDAVAAM